jgi:hypothetical protein
MGIKWELIRNGMGMEKNNRIENMVCNRTPLRYIPFPTVYILSSFCLAYIPVCYCLAITLL